MNRSGTPEALAGYQGTGRQVGAENAARVAAWTYAWGWTTEPVIQALLGVKRRPCRDLVRRGVLQQITPPPGHLTAYIVGSAWLPKALERFEKTHGFLIDYPYPRTAIPFSAYGSHSHQVQLIALAQFNQRYGQIIAERVLRKQSTKEAVPDFIFRVRGKVEWHEVELSPKYTERLFFQLQERESARRAGRFTKLVWWCARPGIADNLTAALNRERIPYVQRRGDGRIVRDDTMEGWNPAQLRKASKILLVDDMKSDPVEFNNCRINFSEPIKQEGFA